MYRQKLFDRVVADGLVPNVVKVDHITFHQWAPKDHVQMDLHENPYNFLFEITTRNRIIKMVIF